MCVCHLSWPLAKGRRPKHLGNIQRGQQKENFRHYLPKVAKESHNYRDEFALTVRRNGSFLAA